MPDIKRQTAHLSVQMRPADAVIDPDDLQNPDGVYDDTTDSLFGNDIDRGGVWVNMVLSCLTDEPVAMGSPAVLRLSGISTTAGLSLFASAGKINISATRIPETITEDVSFVNADSATLSYLPAPGETVLYQWIGAAPAVDRVAFEYRTVTLPTAFTGVLQVTYITLYHKLKLSAVNDEPAGVADGSAFTVLAVAKYGDCTASCEVQFQDTAATDCDRGRVDGYADGYADGQKDKNNGDTYGTSYDSTGYAADSSQSYITCYVDGYSDGYNDGFDGDPYDDDDAVYYDSYPLRVVNFCTGDPVSGATVFVAGVSQGTTGSTGVINLAGVYSGQALKITHPDYTPSDQDAIANDFLPRI